MNKLIEWLRSGTWTFHRSAFRKSSAYQSWKRDCEALRAWLFSNLTRCTIVKSSSILFLSGERGIIKVSSTPMNYLTSTWRVSTNYRQLLCVFGSKELPRKLKSERHKVRLAISQTQRSLITLATYLRSTPHSSFASDFGHIFEKKKSFIGVWKIHNFLIFMKTTKNEFLT